MEFECEEYVPRDSPDITLKNFSKKGHSPGRMTPVSFWVLSSNCSNMVTDTDLSECIGHCQGSAICTQTNMHRHTKGKT